MSVPKLNVLVAWPYCKGEVLRHMTALGAESRFLLDSGAFTAFKAGKTLALDDYCRFIETLAVPPWRYFALDVIGDPLATRRNYEAMLDRGMRPIPVFTRGEDPAELDRMYETTDVVGLGGVAGADKAAYAWVKWLMPRLAGRKVHILGFTSMDWLKFCKPWSADSSTWDQCARFGRMDVYLGRGRFRTIPRQQVVTRPLPPDVQAAVMRMGFDPLELRGKAAWSGRTSLSVRVAVASWLQAAGEMERHLGTQLFLAVSGSKADILFDTYNATAAARQPMEQPA